MASAVAMKVLGLVMTSSPEPTPAASKARCRALVPEFSATQCLASQNSANSFSKEATSAPRQKAVLRQTRSSASRISSRRAAYCGFRSKYGTFINVFTVPLYCIHASARDFFVLSVCVSSRINSRENPRGVAHGRRHSRGKRNQKSCFHPAEETPNDVHGENNLRHEKTQEGEESEFSGQKRSRLAA